MCSASYSAWVKTIEAIRMANYKRLVAELQQVNEGPVRPVDIARALGISKVYAWQLENGKRDAIDSKAARLIERKAGKPEGWMDTDFELWPFPDASLLERVEQLRPDQRVEVQGAIRQALAAIEQQPKPQVRSGKSSGSNSAGSKQRAA